MSVREIVTLPAPVLRKKAQPVKKFDGSLQELVDDMLETMRAAPGVGLAAPQIGESLQIITVEYPENDEVEDSPKRLYVMVNPEIIKEAKEREAGVEGCLSVPGLLGEVERSLEVVVRGKNRHGQPMKIKAKGWTARIFQHEIDHLNGIVFTDRSQRIWQPKEPIQDNV